MREMRRAVAHRNLCRHADPGERITLEGAGINVVGLLQIAELYRPVVAERGGVISAIHAELGGLVGYGAPLVELAADVPPPPLPRIERADDGN